MVDDRDPAAHWAMGRAHVAARQQDQSVAELERAVDLSARTSRPAHYTLAFVHSQSGDPHAAIAFSDHSRQLSPFDPLLFAMLGARAMSLARLGDTTKPRNGPSRPPRGPTRISTSWRSPHSRSGSPIASPEANDYAKKIRERVPNYTMADFLGGVPLLAGRRGMFKRGEDDRLK